MNDKLWALIQYGDALFEACFSIDNSGNVRMDEDIPIVDKLRLLPEQDPSKDETLWAPT
jgi:hypothetical protein